MTDRSYRAPRLAAIGLGRAGDFTTDRARRAAAAIGLQARQKRIGRIGFVARGRLGSPEVLQAITEGLTLAEFDGAQYKTMNYEPFELKVLALAIENPSDAANRAVERGRVLGESSNISRRLANEPANRLTPSLFADRLATIAREGGLSVEVLPDVYRDIVEILTDAGKPMQAKQIVPRIGLPAVTAKIEGTRGKLKRLVERGWLAEAEPGRFTAAHPGREVKSANSNCPARCAFTTSIMWPGLNGADPCRSST